MNTHEQPLIGKWVSITDNALSPIVMDATCLEFRDDGIMTYRLSSMSDDERIDLQYSPAVSSLLIHHPVDDWEKQIPFELTNDGLLSLSLGSTKLLLMRSFDVH